MLLRRIKIHIKKENWFAVWVDFCIVVVGVFLGIQVANWNDEQSRKAQEHSYLVLLHDELIQNAERATRLLNFYTTVTDAGERALDFLNSDEMCAAACDDLLIDFFHASQLWAVVFDQTAFDESLSLGFPSNNALREELLTTYLLTNSFGAVNQISPPFREALRAYIEPEAARILWSGCWEIDVAAVTETLTRGCSEPLKNLDTTQMLQAIKSDSRLAGMLRYWLNQNIVAMLNYPTVKDRTSKSAGLVAAEIEKIR